MRAAIVTLLFLNALLQAKLWFGDGGFGELRALNAEYQAQQTENERLALRNRALAAEVMDLREGLEAVEELARMELGMIQPDEEFYQVVD